MFDKYKMEEVEIRHVPSCYDKTQLPSLTSTQLVFFDEVHVKQVCGRPSTSLLCFLETQYYIDLEDLLRVDHRLVRHEPRQRIQDGWMSMKEAGIYRNRMVHALFPPLPFCIKQTIRRRWNKSSFYLCLCITFFFPLWYVLNLFPLEDGWAWSIIFLFGVVLLISTYPHYLYKLD